MNNIVNSLTNDEQSSLVDFIDVKNSNKYQVKIYQNRYWFVLDSILEFIQRKPFKNGETINILDAATGAGAGAAYLYEQLYARGISFQITAVDLDATAINLARGRYLSEIKFKQQDIVEAVNSDTWDVVVSMETLEHITQETMTQFIGSIERQLKSPGIFVCSSPRCRPRESTVKRPGHINEMYYQQFKYTLGEYFPRLEFAGMDRYGNLVADYPDVNLMLAVCLKPPRSEVFE